MTVWGPVEKQGAEGLLGCGAKYGGGGSLIWKEGEWLEAKKVEWINGLKETFLLVKAFYYNYCYNL